MMHHYGTTPLIRQCVTPGMMECMKAEPIASQQSFRSANGCTCTPTQKSSASVTA